METASPAPPVNLRLEESGEAYKPGSLSRRDEARILTIAEDGSVGSPQKPFDDPFVFREFGSACDLYYFPVESTYAGPVNRVSSFPNLPIFPLIPISAEQSNGDHSIDHIDQIDPIAPVNPSINSSHPPQKAKRTKKRRLTRDLNISKIPRRQTLCQPLVRSELKLPPSGLNSLDNDKRSSYTAYIDTLSKGFFIPKFHRLKRSQFKLMGQNQLLFYVDFALLSVPSNDSIDPFACKPAHKNLYSFPVFLPKDAPSLPPQFPPPLPLAKQNNKTLFNRRLNTLLVGYAKFCDIILQNHPPAESGSSTVGSSEEGLPDVILLIHLLPQYRKMVVVDSPVMSASQAYHWNWTARMHFGAKEISKTRKGNWSCFPFERQIHIRLTVSARNGKHPVARFLLGLDSCMKEEKPSHC